MKSLHVHIGRLTVEGQSRAEARLVGAAIERHLAALANGAAPAGVAPNPDGADGAGRRIAAEVFRKIGGTRHA